MLNREHSSCTLTINKVTQLSSRPKCKTPELWRETRTFWNNLIFTAEQSDPFTVGFTQHLSGSINQKLFGGGGGPLQIARFCTCSPDLPPGNGLWQTAHRPHQHWCHQFAATGHLYWERKASLGWSVLIPVCCNRSTLLGEECITGLIGSYTSLLQQVNFTGRGMHHWVDRFLYQFAATGQLYWERNASLGWSVLIPVCCNRSTLLGEECITGLIGSYTSLLQQVNFTGRGMHHWVDRFLYQFAATGQLYWERNASLGWSVLIPVCCNRSTLLGEECITGLIGSYTSLLQQVNFTGRGMHHWVDRFLYQFAATGQLYWERNASLGWSVLIPVCCNRSTLLGEECITGLIGSYTSLLQQVNFTGRGMHHWVDQFLYQFAATGQLYWERNASLGWSVLIPVCCNRSTLLGEECITGLISSYTSLLQQVNFTGRGMHHWVDRFLYPAPGLPHLDAFAWKDVTDKTWQDRTFWCFSHDPHDLLDHETF